VTLQAFVRANRKLSRRLYHWAAKKTARRSGAIDFAQRVVPSLLRPHAAVLDVGGGKFPLIDASTKRRLGLRVVGLDISADELRQAPAGSYDATIVGDVATADIPESFDVILSRTLLEHVADPPRAIANLARALRPGGVMAHLVPCRRAAFATINRLLGNRLAKSVLFAIYPEKRTGAGFPAYYRFCTPSEMSGLCRRAGLDVEVQPYFESEYFNFFTPLYAVELLRQLTMLWLGADDFCETFVVVARKPAAALTAPPRAA